MCGSTAGTTTGWGSTPQAHDFESLRTRAGLWEVTAHELIDTVPVVVLDTRVVSDPVLREADWSLHPDRLHRVLFVTDDEGNAPVLETVLPRNEIERLLQPQLVKESELRERVSASCATRCRQRAGLFLNNWRLRVASALRLAVGGKIVPG